MNNICRQCAQLISLDVDGQWRLSKPIDLHMYLCPEGLLKTNYRHIPTVAS